MDEKEAERLKKNFKQYQMNKTNSIKEKKKNFIQTFRYWDINTPEQLFGYRFEYERVL